MYWWNFAADLARKGSIRRFGFVTTSKITQPLNRKVVEPYFEGKDSLSILFAIPDHPWADEIDSADVRIAMTVAGRGERAGTLLTVVAEHPSESGMPIVSLRSEFGQINPDLSIGVDLRPCVELRANKGIAIKGFELGSQGFLVSREMGSSWASERPDVLNVLHPYMNGEDLKDGKWRRYVVDFFGRTEAEARAFPKLYQHVYDKVVSDRATNPQPSVTPSLLSR